MRWNVRFSARRISRRLEGHDPHLNPEFIAQKGQPLYALVSTAGTRGGLPGGGSAYRPWGEAKSEHEHPAGECYQCA